MRAAPVLPFLLLLACSACRSSFTTGGFATTKGSGTLLVEKRDAAPFRRIEVSSAFQVLVERADAQTVEVRGDDNLVPLVSTEAVGGVLRIGWKPSFVSVGMTQPLVVRIALPCLEGVQASGASCLELRDLRAGRVTVELSGASRLKVSGTAEELDLEASGASSADASGLSAVRVRVDLSGASHAEVRASDSVTGEASGASSLVHVGNPSRVDVKVSGASSVKGS